MTIINTSPDRPIQLGYEGEDRVTVLRFHYPYEWLSYGEGVFHIRVRRRGESQAYNAQIVVDDRENTCLLMTVTDVELSVKGSGEMQIVYSGENFIKKSPIYSYNVSRAVDEAVDPPAQDVYTQIIESLSGLHDTVWDIDRAVAETDAHVGNLADLTTTAKTDLVSAINEVNEHGGSTITVDSALSDTSENPVQNKTITGAIREVSSYARDLSGVIDGLGEDVDGLETALRTKADIQTASALSDAVQGLDGDVQGLQTTKADKSYVDTQLAGKASTQTVSDLADDVSELQTGLAGKVEIPHTDEAKVAIQKMLGIYEAPWELVGSGSFDNATSEDCIINTDSNGDAFELTDAVLELFVPTHDAETIIADYGRVYFMRGSSNVGVAFVLPSQAKTITANSGIAMAIAQITQERELMRIEMVAWAFRTNRVAKQLLLEDGIGTESAPIRIKKDYINSIKIGKITGQLQYRLYGKRKWT